MYNRQIIDAGGLILTFNHNPGKIIDFSADDIKEYLEEVKNLISKNKYNLSVRNENEEFTNEYRLNSTKIKEIMLNLHYRDFCYAAVNRKPEFAHERLYVFCKEYELDHWGEFEDVLIYIKTNLTQLRNGEDFMILISFHELKQPISYLFR